MYVELRDGEGRPIRGMPDPSGDTFDAAGDFDRFIDESYFGRGDAWDLPTLSKLDPYAITEMRSGEMAALLADVVKVIPEANAGPELRGVLRLQAMAQTCERTHDSVMVWLDDQRDISGSRRRIRYSKGTVLSSRDASSQTFRPRTCCNTCSTTH